MVGTVGHLRFKPENLDKILAELNDPVHKTVEGYRSSQLLVDENVPGPAVVVVWFEDRDTYFKNADDPAQDARYRRMRAPLEGDPTWTDGEWHVGTTR